MSSADRQREFAVDVVRRLQEAGFRALWNGGCVRDFLMGRVPKDYDVATDARPDAVRSLFGHRRTLAVGASFGVIIVLGPKQAGNVEVATFRTEGPYLDGRRPEHVDFASPEEDAQRRDFTINGMFYDPISEQVHDYVGGEKDLAAGVVRAIGRPADRMAEDKLRMLRAVRFAATLDFQLDAATADAVRAMAPEIHVVSAERIAQELKKMLVDPHRRRAIELAHETNLLLEILPELKPVFDASDGVAWEAALRRLRCCRTRNSNWRPQPCWPAFLIFLAGKVPSEMRRAWRTASASGCGSPTRRPARSNGSWPIYPTSWHRPQNRSPN